MGAVWDGSMLDEIFPSPFLHDEARRPEDEHETTSKIENVVQIHS